MSALNDTIVAISTPPGRGGIGIVRLSGPEAFAVATQLVTLQAMPEHAQARFTRIVDPSDADRTIDDAIVTAFHAPQSYTGEDLVEIAAHGSPVILDSMVRSALQCGSRLALPVRLATPGEFTQRAFFSGRLDLTQAEAVHDLISAQTLDQARVAAQQMGGAISHRVAPAKGSLLHLIALLEAGMDFASGELDDVEVVPPSAIAAAIAETREPLEELARSFRHGQLIRSGLALALVGLPNAGKSSLFNKLLSRDRAIVTPVPGTTRDTLEETVALGGIPIRLIDTAGLRAGNENIDEAESLGIARSYEALADADLVLFLHDATQPLSEEETSLLDTIAARPHLLVATKIDLQSREAENFESRNSYKLQPREAEGEVGFSPLLPEPAKGALAPHPAWLPTSSVTGAGLDDLRASILRAVQAEGALADTGALNNLRQQQAVVDTLAALEAAAESNAAHQPHEIVLLDLHAALRALDSLTGITTTDDILARIFSTFCIGK